MTPEEERALYEEFLAQRDNSEEAEERFDQRGQLDQDWHDFLQARAPAPPPGEAKSKVWADSDPNRPETEEDGIRAGALRIAKYRHQAKQMRERAQAAPPPPPPPEEPKK